MATKKYASLTTLQTFLTNLKNLFATKESVDELSADVAYINSTDNETVTDVEDAGGGAGAANAILYTTQTLTDAQKTQACKNIGIPSITSADAGKFMRVSSDGKWVVESLPAAEEVAF